MPSRPLQSVVHTYGVVKVGHHSGSAPGMFKPAEFPKSLDHILYGTEQLLEEVSFEELLEYIPGQW